MDGAGITTGNARGIGNTAKDATYLACEPNAAALGRNAAMRWEKTTRHERSQSWQMDARHAKEIPETSACLVLFLSLRIRGWGGQGVARGGI